MVEKKKAQAREPRTQSKDKDLEPKLGPGFIATIQDSKFPEIENPNSPAKYLNKDVNRIAWKIQSVMTLYQLTLVEVIKLLSSKTCFLLWKKFKQNNRPKVFLYTLNFYSKFETAECDISKLPLTCNVQNEEQKKRFRFHEILVCLIGFKALEYIIKHLDTELPVGTDIMHYRDNVAFQNKFFKKELKPDGFEEYQALVDQLLEKRLKEIAVYFHTKGRLEQFLQFANSHLTNPILRRVKVLDFSQIEADTLCFLFKRRHGRFALARAFDAGSLSRHLTKFDNVSLQKDLFDPDCKKLMLNFRKHLKRLKDSTSFTKKASRAFVFILSFIWLIRLKKDATSKHLLELGFWKLFEFNLTMSFPSLCFELFLQFNVSLFETMQERVFLIIDYLSHIKKSLNSSQANLYDNVTKTAVYKLYSENTVYYNFKLFKIDQESLPKDKYLLMIASELSTLQLRGRNSLYHGRVARFAKALKFLLKEPRRVSPSEISDCACKVLFLLQNHSEPNKLKRSFFIQFVRRNQRKLLQVSHLFKLNQNLFSVQDYHIANRSSPFNLDFTQNINNVVKITVDLLKSHYQTQSTLSKLTGKFFIFDINEEFLKNPETFDKLSKSFEFGRVFDFLSLINEYASITKQSDIRIIKTVFLVVIMYLAHFACYYDPIAVYFILKHLNQDNAKKFGAKIADKLQNAGVNFVVRVIQCLTVIEAFVTKDTNNEKETVRKNLITLNAQIDWRKHWNDMLELQLNHKLVYQIDKYYCSNELKITIHDLDIYRKALKRINSDMQYVKKQQLLKIMKQKQLIDETSALISTETRPPKKTITRDMHVINAYKNLDSLRIHSIVTILKSILLELNLTYLFKKQNINYIFYLLDMLIAVSRVLHLEDNFEDMKDTVQEIFEAIENILIDCVKSQLNLAKASIMFRLLLQRQILADVMKNRPTEIIKNITSCVTVMDQLSLNDKDKKDLLKGLRYLTHFFSPDCNNLHFEICLILSKQYRRKNKGAKAVSIIHQLIKYKKPPSVALDARISLELARSYLLNQESPRASSIALELMKKYPSDHFGIQAAKIYFNYNIKNESVITVVKILKENNLRHIIEMSEELMLLKAEFLERHCADKIDLCFEVMQMYLGTILKGNKFIMQTIPKFFSIAVKMIDEIEKQLKSKDKHTWSKNVEKCLTDFETKTPAYKLILHIQLILSKADEPSRTISDCAAMCVIKIINAYPEQGLWWLMGMRFFAYPSETGPKLEFVKLVLHHCDAKVSETYAKTIAFFKSLIDFGREHTKTLETVIKELKNLVSLKTQIMMPLRRLIFPHYPSKRDSNDQFNPFPDNPIYMVNMINHFEEKMSKEKPKVIRFEGSDKKTYSFLIKHEPESDVRKESRIMDFIEYLNFMLKTDEHTKDQNFHLRTYAILPLSSKVNLIEFLENSEILTDIFEKYQNRHQIYHIGRKKDAFVYEEAVFSDPRIPRYIFKHHLFQISSNEYVWLEKQINFIKSWAAWSVLSYIIRFGDRHHSNIMLHNETGIVSHIDFDCIFDKGRFLPIPETVDFRLTANNLKAMGVTECWGLFQYYFKILIQACSKNIDNIMGILSVFVTNPLLGMFVAKSGPHNKPIKEEYAPNRLENLMVVLNDIKMNIQKLVTHDVDANIIHLLMKNQDPSRLKGMYIGWYPHI